MFDHMLRKGERVELYVSPWTTSACLVGDVLLISIAYSSKICYETTEPKKMLRITNHSDVRGVD